MQKRLPGAGAGRAAGAGGGGGRQSDGAFLAGGHRDRAGLPQCDGHRLAGQEVAAGGQGQQGRRPGRHQGEREALLPPQADGARSAPELSKQLEHQPQHEVAGQLSMSDVIMSDVAPLQVLHQAVLLPLRPRGEPLPDRLGQSGPDGHEE